MAGCVLGCMSDLKDVHEYVQYEVKRQAVNKVKMRRLLRYVNELDQPDKQKQYISMVRMHHRLLPFNYHTLALELSSCYNIFEYTSASKSALQHRVR